jgi:hypothetical protein
MTAANHKVYCLCSVVSLLCSPKYGVAVAPVTKCRSTGAAPNTLLELTVGPPQLNSIMLDLGRERTLNDGHNRREDHEPCT